MSIVVRYQPKSLTAEKYDATTEQLQSGGLNGRLTGWTTTSVSGPTGT